MIGRCSLYLCAVILTTGLFTSPAHSATPSFTGRGQQASRLFALDEGLVVFTLEHMGNSNFIVNLLDDNGNYIDNLTNVVGSFNGSKAVRIPRSGSYLLNVDADGQWKIGLLSRKASGTK